jgi:hypothetical protein
MHHDGAKPIQIASQVAQRPVAPYILRAPDFVAAFNQKSGHPIQALLGSGNREILYQ